MTTLPTPGIAMRDSLHACNANDLPWAPWAMQGASFKLLHADPESGRFTLLIRFNPGSIAPAHRHIGAVEGLVLEGGFHYADAPERRYTAGTYLLEEAGAVHQPVSPEGAVMFAVFHGPVEGLDGQGQVTGCIDWKWHALTWQFFLDTTTA